MKEIKCLFVTALSVAALTFGAWAQTSAGPKPTPQDAATTAAPAQPAVTAADVQALKDGLATALQQIQALQDELQRRDQAVQQAQSTAAEAAAKADAAQLQTSQQLQTVDALQSDVANLKSVNTSALNNPVLKNAVLTLQDSPQTSSTPEPEQIFNKQMESPITIRFRGINITPGGYAAAEFIHRSRALAADVSTPFNNLTMPGASQSQMGEFYGSGRQSKITTFVDGRLGSVDLSSYVSADFLSAGVTSTSTSTNGYTLRLRQAWAQAKFNNGWSFLGGQSWSLVTEDAKGIAPDDDMGKTNDARPKTIDAAYSVGFNFARQYGIRATKSFGDKVAVAVALENPQATLATLNNTADFLLGAAGDGKSYNSGGTYSFNPSPDIIAKIAFDPGFGHYEIFGLVDRFATRVFPCEDFNPAATAYVCGSGVAGKANATGAYNTSKNGGGFGASARWNLFAKHITFGLKGFGGNGVGRYGSGGLSDATVVSSGTVFSATGVPESAAAKLQLLRNLQGLSTLEWHGKKLDIYGYGGVEYAGRAANEDLVLTAIEQATTPTALPVFVGYGSPYFPNYGCYTETGPSGTTGFVPGSLSNCTGHTRAGMEGTVGFWYRFYSGPRGRFQFGTQYSYVTRNTWAGANGSLTGSTTAPGAVQPNGIDNMIFTSFRFYLP